MNFNDEDIKPCPFCGSKAEWLYLPWDSETGTGDDGSGYVKCTKCGAEIFELSRDDGVKAWNNRITRSRVKDTQ